MNKLHHILVPVDGSEHSRTAVEQAMDLAQQYPVEISFLYVINLQKVAVDSYLLDEILASQRATGEKILSHITSHIPTNLKANSFVEEGHPADVIVAFARENKVDLIIMGNRGLGAIKSVLLGSVSQHVIQHAHCSVMISKS